MSGSAKQSDWRKALNKFVRGGTTPADVDVGTVGTPGLTRPQETPLPDPANPDPASPGPASPDSANTSTGNTDTVITGTGTVITDPAGTPANPFEQLRRLLPYLRRKQQPDDQASQADIAKPLLEGYEGLDYEVVRTGRGPGTRGAILVLVVLLGIAVVGGVRTVDWLRQKLDPPGDPAAEVIVTLPPGSSSAAVSELLAGNGIIPDATAYEWYVRLRGGPTFQAGNYAFQQNSSVWEALEILRGGPLQIEQAEQVALTFPEGLTVKQMAEVIDAQENLRFSGEEFIGLLNVSPAISTVAPPPRDIAAFAIEPSEGLLFGDTYFTTASTTAAGLITTMSTQMDSELTDLGYADSFARVGLTPYEAIIVASIVEGEASRPEDRPKLAQVIYNRLAAGMMLGMDATVRYLVGGADVDAPALALDSPYNTRLNRGLPPTPINSPSRDSLRATLEPEPGDWLFVVKTAEDGTLSFSVEYDQFLIDRDKCIELGFCG